MPETKDGSIPADYAEYRRKQSLELPAAPVRDVEDSTETPEERTRRFLKYSVPEDETPDQRTQRYMERARREGYTVESPMAPRTGGDIGSSLDKYRGNDEQDNAIRQKIHDTLNPSWGDRVAARGADYLKEHMAPTTLEAIRNAARRYVDRVDPAQAQARQDETLAEQKRQIEILQRYSQPPIDGGEIDGPDPNVRQPGPIVREDPAVTNARRAIQNVTKR